MARNPQHHALAAIEERLLRGEALIPDSPTNLLEVVGVLESYGRVLDAYHRTLLFVAEGQFLELFPFFKYFNGEVTPAKLWRHWRHDRINYEFAEYCMRAMLVHGGGHLDAYLDSPDFCQRADRAITAKLGQLLWLRPLLGTLNHLAPEFLREQVRMMAYYYALGAFWQVMAAMFLDLGDRYHRGHITSIPHVVWHIRDGLVAAATKPIVYRVAIAGETYTIIPPEAEIQFLRDTAVPYVEAVFFRSFPFRGAVSYNAQLHQISRDPAGFTYGALYADPLPVGGAGIPPALLMQDMKVHLPDYLHQFYAQSTRATADERIKICISFQKSMFCVTSAAILGLAPYPIPSTQPQEWAANQSYLRGWLERLKHTQLLTLQDGAAAVPEPGL
jgi:CO2 hydration protein